jgi:hypothetical protein
MFDQLPNEIFNLHSGSIAELRELKTDQLLRAKGTNLSSHAEGHVVDAEDQFHDLVHSQRHRSFRFHKASADAQINDPCWNRLVTCGQRLDAGQAGALKARSAP